MRAVCQRVSEARVRVAGETVSEIGPGLCVLLGVARGDGAGEAGRLADKVARLRIFPDEAGRFDSSLLDVGGAALVVSQFTLIADTAKGNRPSFAAAAPPAEAEPLYERFCAELSALGVVVERGVFGAAMELELVNDARLRSFSDVDDRVRAVLESLADGVDDPESRKYAHTHGPRYETLLAVVERVLASGTSSPRRLLDVGPSYETAAIRLLHPDVVVDSLGFADERFAALRPGERHVEFDLNDADDADAWPALEGYDVVVCAEVVEHLHTSPVHALRMLASFLSKDGFLVVQTPNAAALSRRFWLLVGRNPFEPIRESRGHTGHFREYTLDELTGLARRAGLVVVDAKRENYFLTGSRKNRLLVRFGRLLPAGLRQGITAELRLERR